jgi:hypothetical protein
MTVKRSESCILNRQKFFWGVGGHFLKSKFGSFYYFLND